MKKLSENTQLKRSTNNLFRESNKFGSKYLKLELKSGIKSVDLPQYYFTNFLNQSDKTYAKFLNKTFSDLSKGLIDIETEYEPTMIGINNNLKSKLNDIHLETYYYAPPKLPYLYKLKKHGNEGFQLYFYKESGNNIILFVDLYHLIILAPNRSRDEKLSNPKYYYDLVGNDKRCISEFINYS